jgi:hypothetical protein
MIKQIKEKCLRRKWKPTIKDNYKNSFYVIVRKAEVLFSLLVGVTPKNFNQAITGLEKE